MSAYLRLIKPGIIFGNLLTAYGGFMLASRCESIVDYKLLIGVLCALGLIVAGACIWNNYIDREIDQKMQRTKSRPRVTPYHLFIANGLVLIGAWLLYSLGAYVSMGAALIGFLLYVAVYSPLKMRSPFAAEVGSIAGAMPPIVGYSAVTASPDLALVLLFSTVALWQMPHFFAIAVYRLEEYAAAGVPVLPHVRGVGETKVQMLLYVVLFVVSALLLHLFGYVGYGYLCTMMLIGGYWIWVGIQGFWAPCDRVWARKMFFISLIAIMALSLLIL